MAAISSKAMGKLENRYRYNGNEKQEKEFSDGSGLEVYDFNARTFDPQIGRFIQIDPWTDEGGQESLSPYHFSYNNPVRYNDPDGKCPSCIIGGLVGALLEYGSQVVVNRLEGKSWSESLTDVDGVAIGISAGAGFISSGSSAFAPKGAAGKALQKGVEVTIDAGESALQQYNETGSVSLSETVTDVVSGKIGVKLTDNVKVHSDNAVKATEKQLDRAQRVAAGDPASSGRAATVNKLENKATNQARANQAGNQAASGVVSNAVGGTGTASSSSSNNGKSTVSANPIPAGDNTAIKRPIIPIDIRQ
jgi:RHS repeat-associated protein